MFFPLIFYLGTYVIYITLVFLKANNYFKCYIDGYEVKECSSVGNLHLFKIDVFEYCGNS